MCPVLGISAIWMSLFLLMVDSNLMAAEKSCIQLPASIERALKKHAQEIRGAEYCEFRTIAKGDLNSNGAEDIVIAYNIEGACYGERRSPGSCGNDHTTFLTAFLGQGSGFRQIHSIEVGGRGQRDIVSIRLTGGRIEADTLEYDPSDPQCCPSRKRRATFFLSAEELVEAGR